MYHTLDLSVGSFQSPHTLPRVIYFPPNILNFCLNYCPDILINSLECTACILCFSNNNKKLKGNVETDGNCGKVDEIELDPENSLRIKIRRYLSRRWDTCIEIQRVYVCLETTSNSTPSTTGSFFFPSFPREAYGGFYSLTSGAWGQNSAQYIYV